MPVSDRLAHPPQGPREAIVDADAITENVRTLRHLAPTPEFIAVVKADGYGHGATTVARAAIRGGATRIGVADLAEALRLVDDGIRSVPVLAWLHAPDQRFNEAARAGIELGISTRRLLDAAADAGAHHPVAVHLKLETGLARGGLAPEDWADAFAQALAHERAGSIRVVGLFSHLSGASPADDLAQAAEFRRGVALADGIGLSPDVVHLAATAATLALPETHFSGVRVGLGLYGLSPFADRTAAQLGLRPALTLRAPVAAVRRVAAGHGVSYDYAHRTTRETTLALVPLGYADGIPRHASDRGPVSIGGTRYRVAGRIAMDQFVVDVGDDPVREGDVVTVFGDPATGVPSAAEWALAADTIGYEIAARLGPRVVRRLRRDPS